MKKQYFLFWSLLVLLLNGFTLAAQLRNLPTYHVDNIPDSLRGKGVQAVLRDYHVALEVRSVEEMKTSMQYAVTVFSEEAFNWTMLHIFYSNKFNKVSDIEGKLYDASGKEIKRLKSNNIQDFSDYLGFNFASDRRHKVAKFETFNYPATFVFSYEMTSSNTMFYPHWNPHLYDNKIPVQNASMTVKTPANNGFRFKSFHLHPPSTSSEADKQVWKWEVKNLKRHIEEPFSPQDSIASPFLLLAPTNFRVESYAGNMTTWKDFGKFLYTLYDKRDEIPENLKKELLNLVADCPDKRCKVERVYDYLQKNSRYVSIQLGIGGWQPILANEVASKKYGDCKALSNFTKGMLKAVGVSSSIVIISGGEDFIPLQRDFPVSTFNHATLCVPMESDTLWLECTSPDDAAGFCGNYTGNRDALVIDEQGGTIAHTKKYDMNDNQQIRNSVFQLNAEGVAHASIQTKRRGILITKFQPYVSQGDKDRRDAYFEGVPFSNFEIKKIDYLYQKTFIPEIAQIVDLQMNTYAKKSGKRLFVPLTLFKPFEFDLARLDSFKNNRMMPVVASAFPFQFIDTSTIELPNGFQVESRPQNIAIESCFGTYKTTIIVEKNKVQYIRNYQENNIVFPRDKYNELLDFYEKIQKADRLKLVLVAQ